MIDRELRVGDRIGNPEYVGRGREPYIIVSINKGVIQYKDGGHDNIDDIKKHYNIYCSYEPIESIYLIHN